MILSGSVARICVVVPFVGRFCHCEVEWTQENVIEFIVLYKRKEIIWDPKHPMHFNEIKKKTRCMGGTGKRNEETRQWVQKENGELTVISPTGENEDEERQWNRRMWVLLIEIFMYFGNAHIFSWNETTAFYTLLGILTTLEWKPLSWMKVSAHFFMTTRFSPLIACLEILNRYCKLTYESPLAKKRSVSANLTWTEMAFLNVVSFFEIFSPINYKFKFPGRNSGEILM
jgi:hypothetical protein